MKKVKVIVLRTQGTNCDEETALGFKLAGAAPEVIHINRLLFGETKLAAYSVLALPGGFSYGDDIASGKIFANKLRYRLLQEIKDFNRSGRLIIGICNGFQILVKAGILPYGEMRQTVTLTNNDSGRFECRWIKMRVGKSLWTENLPDVIELPVAHGEGKFYADNKEMDDIEVKELAVLRYCAADGSTDRTVFPDNPNGSTNDIAGITNEQGNVFGLMPHPERFVTRYQYPSWTRGKKINMPFGLTIIKNAIRFAERNL